MSTYWRGARRAAVLITALAVAIAGLNGVAGYFIFSNAADSPLARVDAIVVLGGEHDGREGYAVALAQQGFASTVVLSNPYPPTDPLMRQFCRRRDDGIQMICFAPDPSNTRGEAMMTRRLATEHNWKSILVVSWRYHLPRARLLFGQCLSGLGVSTAARAVPRHYVLPVWYWEYIYFYQFAGIAKAVATDHC